MLIGVKGHHIALYLHIDWRDLIFETPLGDRLGRARLAFQRKGILGGARNLMLGSDIFSRDAHMPRAEGAVQRTQHHILRACIPHLLAPSRSRHDIGGAAHAFSTCCHAKIGIAHGKGLHNRDDGLRARPAEPVHIHRRGRVGNTSPHRCHPRQIHIAWLGIDDMAKGNMTDLSGLNACVFQRGFGDMRAKINRRDP